MKMKNESILSPIFQPGYLGKLRLRNRVIRSAAFEGMATNNRPSQQLKDYHVSVARGGVGMTTLAYASVNHSGISFDTQLWLRDEIIPELADITDAIHKEGAAVSIQIGHCGNMTHYKTAGQLPVAPMSGFNLYSPTFHRALTTEELKQFAKDFGDAVRIAHTSGFDAVEVHAGHGYLISQFLSPYTNHREDEFVGSLKNRMRFMNMCLEEVCNQATKYDMPVIVKTNMRDGFKGGLEIEENIEIAKQIQSFDVAALVLSGGFVSKASMYVMRGSMPIRSMTHYMKQWWLKYGVRMVGKWMIKPEPFSEAYFLEDALKFREALTLPLIYVGGLIRKSTIEDVLSRGFEFVQMARALIRQPDFVNRMRDGEECCGCDHKNYCIARMYSKEMACCKSVLNELPADLRKELNL